jgi:hypothetical protein
VWILSIEKNGGAQGLFACTEKSLIVVLYSLIDEKAITLKITGLRDP